jgi:hypothetical protein
VTSDCTCECSNESLGFHNCGLFKKECCVGWIDYGWCFDT